MSVLDKMIAAVTPPESDAERNEARMRARGASAQGDWLSAILDHHEQIEAAFRAVKSSLTAATRLAAQKQLGILLTGHSIAEEAVIYPALTVADEEGYAAMAYTEQSAAKTQMALLEGLEPMTPEYLDKLEHIRRAVAHHVYEEEGTWFPGLIDSIPPGDQVRMTRRYNEEFDRYVGSDAGPDSVVGRGNASSGRTSMGANGLT